MRNVMVVRFAACLLLFALLTNELVAQEKPKERSSKDVVRELDREMDDLSKIYKDKIRLLNKRFKEAAAAKTEKACAELGDMQRAVAATDLDKAVALRDLVVKLKAAPITLPTVERRKAGKLKIDQEPENKTNTKPAMSQFDKDITELKKQRNSYADKFAGMAFDYKGIGGVANNMKLNPDGSVQLNNELTKLNWCGLAEDQISCFRTDQNVGNLITLLSDEAMNVKWFKAPKSQPPHSGVITKQAK